MRARRASPRRCSPTPRAGRARPRPGRRRGAASGSRTSSRIETPPISSATAAAASSSTSVASTKCPRRASRAAIARPKPRPAPVTTATPRIAASLFCGAHGDRRGERTALYYEVHGDGEPLLCVARAHVRHARLDPAGPGLLGGAPDGDLRQPRRRPVVDGGRAYEIADMARDALALADHLELDTFHLLGVSMGGAIAQEIALQAPERIRTLTLAVTFPAAAPTARRLADVWSARVDADQPRAARGRADAAEPLRGASTSNPDMVEFIRTAMLNNPHPQPPEAFARQIARVQPARHPRPARLAHDADARDRRRARHPRAGLEVTGDRRR